MFFLRLFAVRTGAAVLAILCAVTVSVQAAPVYVQDEVLVKLRDTQDASVVATNAHALAARMRGRSAEPLYHGTKGARSPNAVNAWQRIKLGPGQSVAMALQQLRAAPEVESAEPNFLATLHETPNDPRFNNQWGLENTGQSGGLADADIDAAAAWDMSTGSGRIIVAVIDTGVNVNHQDLANNIWRNLGEQPGNGIDDDKNGYVDDVNGYDFYNNDSNPSDDNGHGTHVAGIIGAIGNNGVGIAGVSWAPQVMVLKVCSAGGSCPFSAIAAAIHYALDRGVAVINMSLGGPNYSQLLYDALNRANGYGKSPPVVTPVVVSAGNSSRDLSIYPTYPASISLPNIITVAASDGTDRLASFSNYGSGVVDIAAPGVNIDSAYLGNTAYANLTGTSMAAPFVTGAAALLLSRQPGRIGQMPSLGYDFTAALASGSDRIASLTAYVRNGQRLNVSKLVAYHQMPMAGDVNGDGLDDALSVDAKAGRVYVALSNGVSFGSEQTWTTVLPRFPAAVVKGDFNGDKKIDLAVIERNTGAVTVLRSTGTAFASPASWNIGLTKETNWAGFAAGDVNGDGKADIVHFEQRFARVYVALSGGARFAAPTQWHVYFAGRHAQVGVGDFNADGKADIINFSNDINADTWVALSTGTAFGSRKLWNPDLAARNRVAYIGDVNGDRRDDVVYLDHTGSWAVPYVALSDGVSFGAGVYSWKTSSPVTAAFVGRFNSDARVDFAYATQDAAADVLVVPSVGSTLGAAVKWHDNFAR